MSSGALLEGTHCAGYLVANARLMTSSCGLNNNWAMMDRWCACARRRSVTLSLYFDADVKPDAGTYICVVPALRCPVYSLTVVLAVNNIRTLHNDELVPMQANILHSSPFHQIFYRQIPDSVSAITITYINRMYILTQIAHLNDRRELFFWIIGSKRVSMKSQSSVRIRIMKKLKRKRLCNTVALWVSGSRVEFFFFFIFFFFSVVYVREIQVIEHNTVQSFSMRTLL